MINIISTNESLFILPSHKTTPFRFEIETKKELLCLQDQLKNLLECNLYWILHLINIIPWYMLILPYHLSYTNAGNRQLQDRRKYFFLKTDPTAVVNFRESFSLCLRLFCINKPFFFKNGKTYIQQSVIHNWQPSSKLFLIAALTQSLNSEKVRLLLKNKDSKKIKLLFLGVLFCGLPLLNSLFSTDLFVIKIFGIAINRGLWEAIFPIAASF